MGLASSMPTAHQARVLEHSQMFRYRRLRDAGIVGQQPHRHFPFSAQPLEDCAAGRVGKGLEKIVGYGLHIETITIRLLVCQAEKRSLNSYRSATLVLEASGLHAFRARRVEGRALAQRPGS